MPNHEYRVALIKDFVGARPDDIKYVYADEKEEAVEIMKKMSREGKYQSAHGGYHPGLPHVAVLEQWNEEEQEWLSVIDD